MSFSRLNGAVLHWESVGPADAPALVFTNSLGSDFRIWDAVVRMLPPQYQVVRYDKRGHGLSETASGPVGIGDHADDLAALLDAAGIAACAVVGLSVGGLIAQSLAAREPGRIRALVLCDTAARIGTQESWSTRIEAVERGGLAGIADAVVDGWFTHGFRERYSDDWTGWRTMLLRTPPDGYIATCAAIRDADLSAEAATIRAPTLCVAGNQDRSTPPDLVRQAAALIPRARFEVIEGAGHLPCLEQPGKIAMVIRRHLMEAGHG